MRENFTDLAEDFGIHEVEAYDDSFFEIQIMTIDEVAKFLKLSSKTIYRLALRGEIPATRAGKSYRFLRLNIIRWLQNGGSNGTGT